MADLFWDRLLENILIEENWEKVLVCECPYLHRQLGLFLAVYVEKNLSNIQAKLKKRKVDLEDPTPLLHKSILDALRDKQKSIKEL